MPATDPPVRILHVAQATATGVAVYVTSLARHQIEQGMDARIACPPWGLLDEWVRRDGLPRFTWTADRQPGWALPQELRDLRAIIDEFDPDIVHLTSSKAGLAGRLVLRGRRPTVFSPEAWSFLLPGWTRRPSLMWERFATRWTTQVLVACEEEAAAGRAAGVHATYAVAEHGVDIEVFGYADDEARAAARATLGLDADAGPLVVCAGRLCYQKGQKPLLAAWRQVRAQVPGSRLLLVGDGEDEAELVAMAPDGVDFVGNRADMAPWYAAADLAVQPSRYEALSFSVLEALSVGRPVVAFDGIGMRTAIGPDAGALVPMDDVDGLAAAIVERLEDPARCRREGQAGHERVVNRFRLDQLGANATRAVLQVLDRPSRPGPSAVPTGSDAPTFLVIGAARSGTTYLTRQLASHPQIGVSEPKEPHFLALAGQVPAFTGPGDDETINRLAITDEAGWRSLFAGHPELRHRGEGSVSTLYYADESIRNVQRYCPDAKMIVLLRDPVERAFSAHQYWRSRGFETETFARGLDLERERIDQGYHHIWHYTEMGRYSDQLGRFFAVFDRDRFLVLGYEDFMADRPAGLSRCFEFLGVDQWDPPDVDLDINAGGNPRSRLLTEGMRRARTVEPARRVLRATVPFSVRERVRSGNVRRQDMAAADRARLESVFATERDALLALLGADAPQLGLAVRILQLHNRQLTRGGADIQMEREADGLRRRGHEVDTMLVDNRQIAEIGRVRSATKAIWNGEAVRELKDRIRTFEPDVVHVQTPFPLMSPAVFVVAHKAGVPVVATSQSFRYSCVKATMLRDGRVCEVCVGRRIKYPAVVHRCYKDSLAGSVTMASTLAVHGAAGTFAHRVDRHIALTPFMRERLIAEGISPDKVVVIPHTPPDPGSPAAERDGYALFVGRFVPEKGILTVIEAWESQGLDIPLVIVGDGVLRPEVEAAAARHGGITVRPWLDPSEVAEVMARAEVLLMTSEWYEGFGVVITEAYAAGTPVIASDVGNFTEMIDPRVTGERYRCADPVDLARAVRWFFTEADRPALRDAAREKYLREFHPDQQLTALEAVYRAVIAERQAAG